MSSALPDRRLTRRDVLAAGGAAALASLVWWSPMARAAVSPLRRSTYLALTDRRFLARRRVSPAGPWKPFTLVEIADLPRAATLARYRGSENAFGLLFDGPLGGAQGIYALDHPAMGRFQLFLTPVGRPSSSQSYEAIVDRLYRQS